MHRRRAISFGGGAQGVFKKLRGGTRWAVRKAASCLWGQMKSDEIRKDHQAMGL
jgi:hypothetical protein